MLAGITPFKARPSHTLDQDVAIQINRFIQNSATTKGFPFVDFSVLDAGSALMLDGVHLTESGYKAWMGKLLPILRSAVRCDHGTTGHPSGMATPP